MENSSENTIPIFDPQKVCDMIRHEYARGRQPASLILGRREAASYQEFLQGPHEASMREDFFYGIEVVKDSATTKMALVGDKGAWDG